MAETNDEVLHYGDDDSVPSDFFDDFSNQDFMAGLDVVDAWDDEEDATNNQTTENGTEETNQNRKTEHSKRPRSRRYGRTKVKRSRSVSSNTRKRTRNDAEGTLKRDPEKAKRDIQKDKDNWTKNNNAKIVSEKLKVVETGLVPPGTEMEVDLKDMKSSVALPDLREKLRKRSRSASFDLSTRLTRRNRSRERRRSPRRRSRTRSPFHRRFSPPHRRSISPRRRSVSLRHSSEEYRFDNTLSPRRRRSRQRSSEREIWLRNRNRHRRSRSRSISNIRRKNAPKDFLEELADKLKYDEKKKKILQEISHKLNEPLTSNQHNQRFLHAMGTSVGPVMSLTSGMPPRSGIGSGSGMVSSPIMGPGSSMGAGSGMGSGPGITPGANMGPSFNIPPNQFYQPQLNDAGSQFDQSYFIGQSNSNMFPSRNSLDNSNQMVKMVPEPAIHQQQQQNIDNKSLGTLNELQTEEDQKAATKLLEDKTISLSDYLSMSAKYNAGSSNPINIHKKVKVLAQCQDAMKALGNNSNMFGRFFYTKKGISQEKPAVASCLSPLRKIPVVRFGFTTPWKGGDEKGASTHSPLQKLLIGLGLPVISGVEQKRSHTPLSTDSDLICVSPKLVPQPQLKMPVVRFQNKFSQTNVFKCDSCQIRKAIKYSQKGIQCNTASVDCGTQITEEDMNRYGLKPFVVGVPKKSLAHLTPAQLLGKDEPIQRRERFSPPHSLLVNSPSKLPSLIDQLKSSMKSFEPNTSNNLSMERDLRMPGYYKQKHENYDDNRHIPQRLLPEDNMRMHQRIPPEDNLRMQQRILPEDNLRMQQRLRLLEEQRMQQSHFEPPERRDNYFSQGYGPRSFF